MAKEQERKRVQYAGRSAAAKKRGTTKKSGSPRALGAWRKEVRKTMNWDRKGVAALAGACLVLLVALAGMGMAVRNRANQPRERRAFPTGMRVDVSQQVPTPDPELAASGLSPKEFRRVKSEETQLEQWLTQLETAATDEEAATAMAGAASIYENGLDDPATAADLYNKLMSNYSDTSQFPQAVNGAVRCAKILGQDYKVETIYRSALSQVSVDTDGAADLCRRALMDCRESSETAQQAKQLLKKIAEYEPEMG